MKVLSRICSDLFHLIFEACNTFKYVLGSLTRRSAVSDMAILQGVAQAGVLLALCRPTKPAAGSLWRRKYRAKSIIPGAGNITRISITRKSEILLRNMTWVFASYEVVNTWLTGVD